VAAAGVPARHAYRDYAGSDVEHLRLLIELRRLDVPLDDAARIAGWCHSGAASTSRMRSAPRGADLPADTAIVSLDVDPATDPVSLADDATGHGYDWQFTISPRELSRSLLDMLAEHVINPAASPIVVIDRDGTARLARLGHRDPAAIVGLFANG
jgi:DNA-binding transcriptional MerR regulator